MHPILPQGGFPVPVLQAAPVAWMLLAPIPVLLVLTGMVLGFRALRDIRRAGGALGGAVAATLAAGLVPAAVIVAACSVGLTLLGEALAPASRSRSEIWLVLGAGAGVWGAFRMMRAMHREATGWTPPVPAAPAPPAAPVRSAPATAAIVLTIVGAALTLLILVGPSSRLSSVFYAMNGALVLDLTVLVGGLICGVVARREPAGRTCAWINGSLFVVMLLLFAS